MNKMTDDEAIEMLIRLRDPEPYEEKITDKAKEALNMGSEALQEKKKADRLKKLSES